MRIHRAAILQVLTVSLLACDTSVETVAETPAPTPAASPASAVAPVQSAYVAVGRVDLQAVVDGVAEGSIDSAAALETKLSSESVANVDLDADGKRDELRIVERRQDKTTVFEVRALPSAKVEAGAKAEVDVDIEMAPVVAELQLEAKADLGNVVARASFSESFVASAKLDANVTVEHTFTGVGVSSEGLMEVDADANAFVAWTFRARRPVFVAEVFGVVHAPRPEPDHCWPPGHCKHGFWKATGEKNVGKHDDKHDVDVDVRGRDHGDDHDRAHATKDHGKSDDKPKGDKSKGDKSKGDKSKGDKSKGDKSKGGGKGK